MKYSYLDKEWHLIARFKVGSVPWMIDKEALAESIYKPGYATEKLFG